MKRVRNTIMLRSNDGKEFMYYRSEGMPKFRNGLDFFSKLKVDYYFRPYIFLKY